LKSTSNYLTVKNKLIERFGLRLFEVHKSFVTSTMSNPQREPDRQPLAKLNVQSELNSDQLQQELHQQQQLVICKAAVAKLRYDSDAFRTYIRNRDRQLVRGLRGIKWQAQQRKLIDNLEAVLMLN